jgi:hypothetical protein
MPDRLVELAGHINSIDAALNRWRNKGHWGISPLVTMKDDVAARIVAEDLSETFTLLAMFYRTVVSLRGITSSTQAHFDAQPDNPDLQPLLWEQQFLTQQATVLLKAIYEWLYHLQEDIGSSANMLRVLSPAMSAELKRLCVFRNLLVTHRHERQFATLSATRMSADLVDIELMHVPFGQLGADFKRALADVFAEAIEHLPPEDVVQSVAREQLAILYRRRELLPKTLYGRIDSLIKKGGTLSDTPLTIAKFVNQLATELEGALPHATSTA